MYYYKCHYVLLYLLKKQAFSKAVWVLNVAGFTPANYFLQRKGTGEQNPLFQLAIDTMLTSPTTWKYKQINTPPTTHQISSTFSTIAADNSTGTYIIHYSIELIAFSAEYTLFNNCNFNLVYRYSSSKNLTLSITVKYLPDAADAVALCSWGGVVVTLETCRTIIRLNIKLCDLCI